MRDIGWHREATLLGVDSMGKNLSAQHLVHLLGGLLLHGRWQERLSRPCIPRLTLSLRQVRLEPAELLPMEEYLGVVLSQQGAEAHLGLFCIFGTTSGAAPS